MTTNPFFNEQARRARAAVKTHFEEATAEGAQRVAAASQPPPIEVHPLPSPPSALSIGLDTLRQSAPQTVQAQADARLRELQQRLQADADKAVPRKPPVPKRKPRR